MELKEFIKATLKEIIEGVKESQEELRDTGAIINPSVSNNDNGLKSIKRNSNNTGRIVQDIEMNIAVTTSLNSQGGAGINIFNTGASGSISDSKSHVSTIKFVVSVSLPITNVTETQKAIMNPSFPNPR